MGEKSLFGPTHGELVQCVVCIADDGTEALHIFSNKRLLLAFVATDTERGHVIYDYMIDEPQRMEGRVQ